MVKRMDIKKLAIIFLFVVVAAGIIIQISMFYLERLDSSDYYFEDVSWSEYCDGRNYTIEEKEEFCQGCFSSGNCSWPLDIRLHVNKARKILSTGGEIHCLAIIDDINYYIGKGSYYGVTNTSFFTWYLLDADKSHDIEFCCGIERDSAVTKILNMHKKWPQSCIKTHVEERCRRIKNE